MDKTPLGDPLRASRKPITLLSRITRNHAARSTIAGGKTDGTWRDSTSAPRLSPCFASRRAAGLAPCSSRRQLGPPGPTGWHPPSNLGCIRLRRNRNVSLDWLPAGPPPSGKSRDETGSTSSSSSTALARSVSAPEMHKRPFVHPRGRLVKLLFQEVCVTEPVESPTASCCHGPRPQAACRVHEPFPAALLKRAGASEPGPSRLDDHFSRVTSARRSRQRPRAAS